MCITFNPTYFIEQILLIFQYKLNLVESVMLILGAQSWFYATGEIGLLKRQKIARSIEFRSITHKRMKYGDEQPLS
jgi:hypothetical protein